MRSLASLGMTQGRITNSKGSQTVKDLKNWIALQRAYRMDENVCVDFLLKEAEWDPESAPELYRRIDKRARILSEQLRETRLKKGGLDAFLNEYDLSSEEGIALMCLAEALLRIPDAATRDRLIKDKILSADWEQHLGKSNSWFVNAGTFALMLTGTLLQEKNKNSFLGSLKRLVARAGEPVIRKAIMQGMAILGKQFVMGETIEEALSRAKPEERKGYRYSYDMLGEAAKTAPDADMYLKAYQYAIEKIKENSEGKGPIQGPGISVKLSALHPRFEWSQFRRMQKELLPILKSLAFQAKDANIGLTIDAEEADRLELTLWLVQALLEDDGLMDGWQGLGLAVQAYQKRAFFVVDWLKNVVQTTQHPLMLRLVKGAYWDSEIKWSQEKGLDYPVFTRKSSTDVCYLAVAKKLFEAGELFFPQFATHNAYTVSSIIEMANVYKTQHYEFQCLHGMGDALYDNIVGKANLDIPCRVYAPVGGHEYLLAYLVRRLLENGSNSSFVNRILQEDISIEDLIENPLEKTAALTEKSHPSIPPPSQLYGDRPNSRGLDLSNPLERDPVLKEIDNEIARINFDEKVTVRTVDEMDEMLEEAASAFKTWHCTNPEERATCLERMAQLLEAHRSPLMALLIREGGKAVPDALSELREAVDYCWYYAHRLRLDFAPLILQGPTGEYDQLTLHGRGVVVCISPWNFPLAIFLGQITAALAAGNTVIAKPSSQTPRIATFVIHLLHEAGFPKEVVHLAIGSGGTVGTKLIEDIRTSAVMLTGSTETARHINQMLANRPHPSPIVPFIAETGGQNAMIVDSSALPEQVVTDVITSAFNSAGQRCSALRVLFVQEEVASRIITMLQGAMQELKIGDPLDLSTDVGPVIDQNACDALEKHAARMRKEAKIIYECEVGATGTAGAADATLPSLPRGVFFLPKAYELHSIDQLTQEVFGPILHVVRFALADLDKILESINNTGYGLTLGIHSRLNETVRYIQERLRVGNTYVNRNMIGAVVGVQPFGGEGLSGTGPKAGGPHMIPRLCVERTLSNNIAAIGGNTALMSLD